MHLRAISNPLESLAIGRSVNDWLTGLAVEPLSLAVRGRQRGDTTRFEDMQPRSAGTTGCAGRSELSLWTGHHTPSSASVRSLPWVTSDAIRHPRTEPCRPALLSHRRRRSDELPERGRWPVEKTDPSPRTTGVSVAASADLTRAGTQRGVLGQSAACHLWRAAVLRRAGACSLSIPRLLPRSYGLFRAPCRHAVGRPSPGRS